LISKVIFALKKVSYVVQLPEFIQTQRRFYDVMVLKNYKRGDRKCPVALMMVTCSYLNRYCERIATQINVREQVHEDCEVKFTWRYTVYKNPIISKL
jgi:hypothetical protein